MPRILSRTFFLGFSFCLPMVLLPHTSFGAGWAASRITINYDYYIPEEGIYEGEFYKEVEDLSGDKDNPVQFADASASFRADESWAVALATANPLGLHARVATHFDADSVLYAPVVSEVELEYQSTANLDFTRADPTLDPSTIDFLLLTYRLDGSLSLNGDSIRGSHAIFSWSIDGINGPVGGATSFFSSGETPSHWIDSVFSVRVSVVPLFVDGEVNESLRIVTWTDRLNLWVNATRGHSAELDFSNTFELTRIEFEDGTTPEERGVVLTFDSGRTSPNLVPEPSAFCLGFLALLGTGCLSHRRKVGLRRKN